ncbi:MAG: hypothetical protein KC777_19265, partial [Cyanobacteria bacterium HKST-UBA02]|nr:hypothetical protein [Cyanobacteria bacterium HKST-UBA02]
MDRRNEAPNHHTAVRKIGADELRSGFSGKNFGHELQPECNAQPHPRPLKHERSGRQSLTRRPHGHMLVLGY